MCEAIIKQWGFSSEPGCDLLETRDPQFAAGNLVVTVATAVGIHRSLVEHVFAQQKSRMNPFVRTIGIARARTKIGMANLAYNFTRFVWHQGRIAYA